MRGTFYYQSKEIILETLGESWNQSDPIRGKILFKDIDSKKLNLALAYADFKDVRAQDHSSFEILETKKIESSSWDFKLSETFPVTEKNGSPYLLLREGENILGHLQISIHLRPMLKNFLETFELFFRFKSSGFKNRKGGFVEFKMLPPKTREYTNLDGLLLSLRLLNENLEIKYLFTTKSLVATTISLSAEVQKKKKEIVQVMSKKDYEFCGAHNVDEMKKFIASALKEVALKMLF